MLALLAAGVAISQSAQIDRSAEPALKQLLASMASLRNAHAVITLYGTSDGSWYLDGSTSDLWLGAPGQFRLETISTMGDESLLVCDGSAVMNDPLSDDDSIHIQKAGKPLHELSPREPFLRLLEGPTAFDGLAAKDQPVTFVSAPSGQKAIETHSSDLGKLMIYYSDDSTPVPLEIDMYRVRRFRSMGDEMTYPTMKETIRWVYAGPVSASLFAIQPEKGAKVEDERKAGG